MTVLVTGVPGDDEVGLAAPFSKTLSLCFLVILRDNFIKVVGR
jgi:hypothetical protein